MFLQTWNKYLPVIKILLKRSVKAEQMLDMNSTDFQRASGGKKVKFTFSIPLIKGRVPTGEIFPPVAKDLVSVLQQDSTAFRFLQQNEVEIAVNSDFQLYIKNNTPVEKEDELNNEEASETEKEDTDKVL
jgi:hypothetical protein